MKMLKKLLAVVLTGAMALTLLTACGGNAVTEKDIADALTDMAKAKAQAQAQDTNVTYIPQAKERELARKAAALFDGKAANDIDIDEAMNQVKEILGCNPGGANADKFVWFGAIPVDKLGTSGQAVQFIEQLMDDSDQNLNKDKLTGKKSADEHYMGTALYKTLDNGKLVTGRIIVVTAAVDNK